LPNSNLSGTRASANLKTSRPLRASIESQVHQQTGHQHVHQHDQQTGHQHVHQHDQQTEAMMLPADLTELNQWILWRYEDGTKVPYQRSGKKASSTNPATWAEYTEVMEAYSRTHVYSGVGFVFSVDDPYVGVDLDRCVKADGTPEGWAVGIIGKFADTYMELSPSGRGVHIFARGTLPSSVGKVKVKDGGIEMYSHARFFTITAHPFRGAPLQIENHAEDILVLHRLLAKTWRQQGGNKYPIPLDGKIPHGTQHLTLVSIAGTLWRRGVCPQAVEACLQLINRWQCEQPGPPANITKIVESTKKYYVSMSKESVA
jgi:hypothetical protein